MQMLKLRYHLEIPTWFLHIATYYAQNYAGNR